MYIKADPGGMDWDGIIRAYIAEGKGESQKWKADELCMGME